MNTTVWTEDDFMSDVTKVRSRTQVTESDHDNRDVRAAIEGRTLERLLEMVPEASLREWCKSQRPIASWRCTSFEGEDGGVFSIWQYTLGWDVPRMVLIQ